jgi:phosphate starvation-inducible PhoH-like protein
VITGDVTQIDLPDNRRSGLTEAVSVLSGIEGIAFRYFTEVDVVRHPLVQEIIKAYDGRGPSQQNDGRGPSQQNDGRGPSQQNDGRGPSQPDRAK